MWATHTKEQDFRSMYVGRKFRYNSKYGSVVENILCRDITVIECIDIDSKGHVTIDDFELKIISDKNNVYDFNEIEFYENND
jgi:hypothetical protein